MYQNPDIGINEWPARDRRRPQAAERAQAVSCEPARRFPLLRWVSILGLVAIVLLSLVTAAILSHFMTREILNHDATLTSTNRATTPADATGVTTGERPRT